MRASTRRIRVAVAAVAAGGVLAGSYVPATAMNEEPLFVDKFNETFDDPGLAAFIEGECNVANITATGNVKGRVVVYEHAVTGHENMWMKVENTDTGQYFVRSWANSFDLADAHTVGDDGLHYVSFSEVFNGLPQKFHAPGIGVIVFDAGRAEIETNLVFDPSLPPPDDLVGFSQSIKANGPHPWAEQGFEPTPEQGAAICAAVGGTP